MNCHRCGQLVGDSVIHEAACRPSLGPSLTVDLPEGRPPTRNDMYGMLGSAMFDPLKRFIDDWIETP